MTKRCEAVQVPLHANRSCRARGPASSLRPTSSTCRRRTRGSIRWRSSAATARSSRTSTATGSSTSPPASPSARTGHCHPQVVAAIQQQAGKLLHMSGTDFYYEPQIDLAKQLARDRAGQRREASLLHQQRRGVGRGGLQAGPLSHRPAAHDRVLRRVSRPHAGRIVADRQQGRAAPRLRAADAVISHVDFPNDVSQTEQLATALQQIEDLFKRTRRAAGSRGHLRRADPGRRRLHRAAAPSFIASCGSCATSTASCWSPTKCSRAWAAPARCSRWSTGASSPTSSAWPRASPAACRWARSSPARTSWTGAPVARQHLRRQSRLLRRGTRNDQAARRRADGKCPRRRRSFEGPAERVDGQASADRRCRAGSV